ncbi:MAG: hypothetical protein ABIP48_23230 [Planctomycetota bacterium]
MKRLTLVTEFVLALLTAPWAESHKLQAWAKHYASKGTKQETETPVPPVQTYSAQEACELVLARAGCFPRDVLTRRTIEEVKRGSGSWGRHEPDDLLKGLIPAKPLPDSDDVGGNPALPYILGGMTAFLIGVRIVAFAGIKRDGILAAEGKEIQGIQRGSAYAARAAGMVHVADSALSEVGNLLDRIRGNVVSAARGKLQRRRGRRPSDGGRHRAG